MRVYLKLNIRILYLLEIPTIYGNYNDHRMKRKIIFIKYHLTYETTYIRFKINYR